MRYGLWSVDCSWERRWYLGDAMQRYVAILVRLGYLPGSLSMYIYGILARSELGQL